jgi:hypothetical protein
MWIHKLNHLIYCNISPVLLSYYYYYPYPYYHFYAGYLKLYT